MRVLVTGGAGFIGSNLTESLLGRGHEVVCLDNLSQGDLLNIEKISGHRGFRLIHGDVLDASAILKAAESCAVIYHLAAFKIPRFGNAYDTLNINSVGTVNAIEACVKTGARLIFASTSDVYGKNPKIPFSENHDLVLGPPQIQRWAYAISKAFDEQLIFAEAERRGLKFSIVRFFGGYGPNQNLTWWGGPQSVFINQILDGQPISVHGDGKQTRSFTYVADHVDGLLKVLESPAALGEVFNLGNDREINIHDLACLISRIIHPNDEPRINFIPYKTFGNYEDVMRRVPDITKSKEVLGFKANWTLEDGLPITIEWQSARRVKLAQRK